MLKLKVLASGSKGNSYILESPTGSLLIEAGIPWQEIIKGLNYDLSKVVGCLVSHLHKDHSISMPEVMKAGIDVYASKETFMSVEFLPTHRKVEIKPRQSITIKDFQVLSFPTEHDCEGNLGFLIRYIPTDERLLFITDSYYSKYKFKNLNYILIECNYIKETLDQNIADGYISELSRARLLQSHFSLENVKGFLRANDLSSCSEILLLHLSSINSNAEQMIREIEELTGIKPKVAEKGLTLDLELFPY